MFLEYFIIDHQLLRFLFSNEFSTLIYTSMLILLQLVDPLMLQYMAILSALRLDDDDTASDEVVSICLVLAVLQYDLRSKPSTSLAWNFPSKFRDVV